MTTEEAIALFDVSDDDDLNFERIPEADRLHPNQTLCGYLKIYSLLGLFNLSDIPWKLHSGGTSRFNIDCDALADSDIECLAWMIQKATVRFSSVEGVPRGGLRLADALKPYCSPVGAHLIADDVFTTGNSMENAKKAWCDRTGRTLGPNLGECVGVVIFARGQLPDWIWAVLPLPECLWSV